MSKQKRVSPKASLNYFDEMRGQMEAENKKRKKISTKLISPPELQFLQFGSLIKDKFNSQPTGKNPVKKAWKPPVKDLSSLNETDSGDDYSKPCKITKLSETFNLEPKSDMPQSFGPLKTETNYLKSDQFGERKNVLSSNNQNNVDDKNLKCCNNILAFHSAPKRETEPIELCTNNYCLGNKTKIDDTGVGTGNKVNVEYNLNDILDESENIENIKVNSQVNIDDLLTQVNPKLNEVSELSPGKSEGKLEKSKSVTETLSEIKCTANKSLEDDNGIKENDVNNENNSESDKVNLLMEKCHHIETSNQTPIEKNLFPVDLNLSEIQMLSDKKCDIQELGKESKFEAENLSDIKLTVKKSPGNKYEIEESNLNINTNTEPDAANILPENIQTIDINCRAKEEEIVTQVSEIEKVPTERGLSQQKDCDKNDYSEHQDILDSIDIILSEGQEKTTETNKNYSKLSQGTSDFSTIDSIFEDNESSEHELRICNKPTETPSLNVCVNIEQKSETQMAESNLNNSMDFKMKICDKEVNIIQENFCKDINLGYDINSQILNSQDKKICSNKEENLIISENEFDFIKEMVESDEVKKIKIDETKLSERKEQIWDNSDEDFSPLMISDSQLLEIEKKCHKNNMLNIKKIEETTSFGLNNSTEHLKTKSVSTQTESLLFQQTNSLPEAKNALWNAKNQERQNKLRAAIREVERLNSALLKMRQQLWPK